MFFSHTIKLLLMYSDCSQVFKVFERCKEWFTIATLSSEQGFEPRSPESSSNTLIYCTTVGLIYFSSAGPIFCLIVPGIKPGLSHMQIITKESLFYFGAIEFWCLYTTHKSFLGFCQRKEFRQLSEPHFQVSAGRVLYGFVDRVAAPSFG